MSVTYDISLKIAYDYESPAAANRAILRMVPRTLPWQSLLSGELRVFPAPDHRQDGTDFFGNPFTQVVHDAPQSEIIFEFSGRVRRASPDRELDLSCGPEQLGAELAAIRSIAPEAPHHFLGASDRVPILPEITEFARSATGGAGSVLDAVRAVSDALHESFDFDPEATEVSTTPAEAFRARRGVCQDISQVMIAGLRGLGIPAGYVSGFLRTIPPPGKPRLEGTDAMHAWVRAWCGSEVGWIGIDPTNAIMAGPDHVVVAIGRDYADVAPVKGSMRAVGGHSSTHIVDVVPVSES